MTTQIFTFPTPPIETNSYLLLDIKIGKACVIDPGLESYHYFLPVLQKHHAQVDKVLLTHGHYDHVGNVTLFQEAGAKVYLHRRDNFFVEDPQVISRPLGLKRLKRQV